MRAAGAVLVCLVVFWTVGLFAFASRIDRSTPAADPPVSDGVVALTGASNARIAVAMQLLEDGRARRLLVSGVNPQASRDDMRGVAKAANRIYDCCVDLGYQATDTFGNARETAHWARAYSYRSLILVTSDFHMPRAMLELEVALPEVRIVAYPVRTTELDARHWWRSSDGIRRMALEYSKYLAALTQESIFRLAPRHHSASDVPAESGAAA